MVAKFIELLSDPEKRERIGLVGEPKWKHTIDRMEQIYLDVLSDPNWSQKKCIFECTEREDELWQRRSLGPLGPSRGARSYRANALPLVENIVVSTMQWEIKKCLV